MSENKTKAIESLKWRIDSLSANLLSATGDDAVAISKKINAYGRTKEILESENVKEQLLADKPAQDAPRVYSNWL